jgi:hypothetical protein
VRPCARGASAGVTVRGAPAPDEYRACASDRGSRSLVARKRHFAGTLDSRARADGSECRNHAVGGVGPLARRPAPVQDRRALIAGAGDAVPFGGPAAGGGRVLSADHAPQTPQAPSEDVSAATRPSTVLAQPGTTARVAVRQRLRLRGRSSCAEIMRDRSPPEYRATVVCLRVGEPTGAPASPRQQNAAGRCESDWERTVATTRERQWGIQLAAWCRGRAAQAEQHAGPSASRKPATFRSTVQRGFGSGSVCWPGSRSGVSPWRGAGERPRSSVVDAGRGALRRARRVIA